MTKSVLYLLQYMSEKIGGAKGTEHDEEFIEMERVSTFENVYVYLVRRQIYTAILFQMLCPKD